METGWWMDPRTIWFLVGLVALIGEVIVPGVFLIFFGFGAWLTAALLFMAPLLGPAWQLAVFLAASVTSLLLFRRKLTVLFYDRRLKPHNLPDELESEFIGQKVSVLDDINPPHPGRVILNGSSWLALADEPVAKGAVVEVINRDGLTLKVRLYRDRD